MKRTLLFAALAATTSLAFAEPPPGPPPGGGRGGLPVEMMTRDLALDANQQVEVKRIFDAQHAKHEAERAQFEASGTRPSREEMDAKREAADAEIRQQLTGVLTAEQLTKFDELRKRGPMRGRPDEAGQQAPQSR